MTDAVTVHGGAPGAAASGALKASATFWFLTAVAGQWAFVWYIAGFYGPTAISGDFSVWERNRGLIGGYVAGDVVGNLFFLVHVLLAAVLTFGGTLQLVPQIRAHAITLHRWTGRIFLPAAVAAALGGLWLVWVRGTQTTLSDAIAISLNAVLILAFAGLAWCAVRRKDIAAHQRWATRLFLAVNGVWFLRVGVSAWMMLTQGAFGVRPFFALWTFGCYLVPLAVYELYRRARDSDNSRAQMTMAAGLFVLTLLMGAGAVGAFLFRWRPLL